MCTTASLFLLQPFLDKKPSGAYDIWSVDIVAANISQRVLEVVVSVERGPVQLEIISVDAKTCIGTGTAFSLSASAIEARTIEQYSKTTTPLQYKRCFSFASMLTLFKL